MDGVIGGRSGAAWRQQLREVKGWEGVKSSCGGDERNEELWKRHAQRACSGGVVHTQVVFPQDMRKVPLPHARRVHWKRWTARCDCEGLEEGAWLESAKGVLKGKTLQNWTAIHANSVRKMITEGGWGCKSDCLTSVGRMRTCAKDVGKKKDGEGLLWIAANVRDNMLEKMKKWSQKDRSSVQDWQWQGGMVPNCVRDEGRRRRHLTVHRWESDKFRDWNLHVPGFRDYMAAHGSRKGMLVDFGACGWAVVELVHDGEPGLMHGLFGTMEVELEVQRTILRR